MEAEVEFRARLQVRMDWEVLVHQAGRDRLLLWGSLLLRRRSLPDESATGLLSIQRHGGIVPRQMCSKDVKFKTFARVDGTPNQHVRPRVPRNSGGSFDGSWVCKMGQLPASLCQDEKEKDSLEILG